MLHLYQPLPHLDAWPAWLHEATPNEVTSAHFPGLWKSQGCVSCGRGHCQLLLIYSFPPTVEPHLGIALVFVLSFSYTGSGFRTSQTRGSGSHCCVAILHDSHSMSTWGLSKGGLLRVQLLGAQSLQHWTNRSQSRTLVSYLPPVPESAQGSFR